MIRESMPPTREASDDAGNKFVADVDELSRRHLRPTMHIHVASTMSRPNALVYAVARNFEGKGRFTVSANAFHSGMHSLVMAGVVERAITCFGGDTVPVSRPNRLYRDTIQGHPFAVEEWSLLSFLQRLVAGATNAPYAVTTSLVGSDLAPPGPEGGGHLLVPALRPEVTLVHAHCADMQGNLYFSGPLGEATWGAMAARKGVIATVEKMCATAPAQVSCSIPADRVLDIAVCPLGAHPQGMSPWPEVGFEGYVDDYAFLENLALACRNQQTAQAWFGQWVRDVGGQHGYVEKLGATRSAELMNELRETSSEMIKETAPTGALPSERERHIVLAARRIVREVRDGGYRTILAGIGVSHVASWLAARLLETEDIAVEVVNELGMIGFAPHPGDTFLFSQQHVARCRTTAGTLEVLGQLAAGGARHTLGVLSAAQVDQYGRINTSRTPSGGFLVGSGGANDIASHVNTVVVAATARHRYVPSVDFVTSPGKYVRCVVAEFGSFERGDDETLRLDSWLSDVSATDAETCIRERTGWKPHIAEHVAVETAPSEQELAVLRTIDVNGIYL